MDYFHNINVVNTQYERILRDQSVLSIWHILHENESISVKFTSLIVGVFEKISKEYTFPRFLPFIVLPKNFISSDLQCLAKLVLAVQL